mmetsp:Transcript_38833/g.37175  ORF Transcript_38833/g.37175 Transcript_38833/m.37175 type:complete len:140 (+) Transcript_38833:127-546(+)
MSDVTRGGLSSDLVSRENSFQPIDSNYFTISPEKRNSGVGQMLAPSLTPQVFEIKEEQLDKLKTERFNEILSMRGSLQKIGRCPICTLQPPCNHYKSKMEIERQNVQEVNEDLEDTAAVEKLRTKDIEFPSLKKNEKNA